MFSHTSHTSLFSFSPFIFGMNYPHLTELYSMILYIHTHEKDPYAVPSASGAFSLSAFNKSTHIIEIRYRGIGSLQ